MSRGGRPAPLLHVSFNLSIQPALEQVCGQHIPRTQEGLGVKCVLSIPSVPELAGRSYQRWMAGQPVKLGGLGLRSLVETCPAAFIGGVEMAFPHMVGGEGEVGICPQLENVVGQVQGEERWKHFITANCAPAKNSLGLGTPYPQRPAISGHI